MKYSLKKRIAASVLAAVTALTAFSALPADAAAAKKPSVLVLGDSISAKYNLKDTDFGYSDYVAAYLQADDYRNLAKSGLTSTQLLDQLTNDAEKSGAVKNADLVLVTIGSNDMLNALTAFLRANANEGERFRDYFLRVAKSGTKAVEAAATKLTSALRTPRNTLDENMTAINARIHELNPDVRVVYQKIYNPFETDNAEYGGQSYAEYYEYFLNYIRGHIKRVNDNCFDDLKDAVITDPYTIFRDNAWKFTFSDKEDIHPNAYGHALMAADTLNRLGYADAVVPQFREVVLNAHKYLSTKTKFVPVSARELLLPHTGISCTHTLGDVDLDGQITPFDATVTLTSFNYFTVLGMDEDDPGLAGFVLNDEQHITADADGDGRVDAYDATLIQTYYTLKYMTGYDDLEWDELVR
ncbi:MAG: hypothetical protein II723_06560 [Oscillospiraceae bacterium]|nr:hypothetical protein [Oscillospiraceae bacterium]